MVNHRPCVILEDTGIAWEAHPGQQVFFDEAAGLIHIVEGRMVSAVALPMLHEESLNAIRTPSLLTPPQPSAAAAARVQSNTSTPLILPSTVEAEPDALENTPVVSAKHYRSGSESSASSTESARAFLIATGPAVTAVRASLDGSFTAFQRTKIQIEFVDHTSGGNMFVDIPRNKDAVLHGFFWTDAPGAEFVMITSVGLEFFSPIPGAQELRLTGMQRLAASQWFLWSHQARILLIGCGSGGAKVQAFQIGRNGVVRLPLLDLTPPWGSPVKRGASTPAASSAPWLLVTPSQIWVLALYERVVIAHHDPDASAVQLYRMYRDATVPFAECTVKTGGAIELSVSDNIIIVHCLDEGTVLLFDCIPPSSGLATDGIAVVAEMCPPAGLGLDVEMVHGALQHEQKESAQEQLQRLELHHPNIALDPNNGRLLRLSVDLAAVADVCTDIPRVLSFLQRRNLSGGAIPFSPRPYQDPRHVTLGVLRRLVASRAPPASLRAAFTPVFAAQARCGRASLVTEIALSIVAPSLLSSSHDGESSSDGNQTDELHRIEAAEYAQAIVAELLVCCHASGLLIDPRIAELYIQAYCERGQLHLIDPLLRSHSPMLDSSVLAQKLAAGVGFLAYIPRELRQNLALQMYERLNEHEASCRILVEDGRIAEAFLKAQQCGILAANSILAVQLLQEAETSGDAKLRDAVNRALVAPAFGQVGSESR